MNAWHISFTLEQPTPGTVTVPADTEEEARAKFEEMTKGYNNAEIKEIVNLEEVPFLKKLVDARAAEEAKADDALAELEAQASDTAPTTETVN